MIVGARQRSVSLCAPQWPRLATALDQPLVIIDAIIIIILILIITIIDMFVISISVVVEALG